MGSNQTGLNPQEVNNCISTANSQADIVWHLFTTSLQTIQTTVDQNWGTQKGKEWITGKLTPSLTDMITKAKTNLDAIGKVISAVGKAQLKDTGNSQAVNDSTDLAGFEISANTQDILDNGYVGVYENLVPDIESEVSKSTQSIAAALGELQTQVIAKTDVAFNKVGAADKVSIECRSYIKNIINIMNDGLKSLYTQVKQETSDADTFAKQIQDAGLRQSSGGGNTQGGPTAALM